MNYFLKANKNFVTYSLIALLVIPIVGIKFFLGFLTNIVLLLLLIPLLLFCLMLLGFNYYKSKINTCRNCGVISFSSNESCINCGADLKENYKENEINKKPSESTIEVKAEEIK